MDTNVQQIANDRLALELGRLMVSKIFLEAQVEGLATKATIDKSATIKQGKKLAP
ncbi:hypothetical protein [Neorhizobium sp. AL 9.2.2]|uniref:hypothetical protein n=1 Tax=Neorhizobium sp. AL 9.2.2 TaxID=2712894 RepID=UPI0015730388|nr:hypothetical protein [Neorhizobium sp. AL 9.2.2]NSY17275.1 hypothetical protein [Neorhizobium sp. AL 9.2.2]